MIVSANEDHIAQIVNIHCASLPDDFLPQLGRDFLEKTFYPAVIASDLAALLIDCDQSGNAFGFIIVTQDSSEFFSQMIKNNLWSFALTGMRSSLRSWGHFRRNIQILISSVFGKETDPGGEIYIIAVDEAMRGKGIGAKLVSAAEDYLRQMGIAAIRIKTLTSNEGWIGFFKKAGWDMIDQFKLIGNDYTVLQKKL
jgi:ribosomal protein S18 acetylase RimI-like enzyme